MEVWVDDVEGKMFKPRQSESESMQNTSYNVKVRGGGRRT
jgi:hypothetical protein